MNVRLKAGVFKVSLAVFPACTKNTSSTTGPTPMQAMSFTSETATPVARSFVPSNLIERRPGQISISIVANNFPTTNRCGFVRGALLFNPSVLSYVNFSEDDWMKQGGALTTFSVSSSNGAVDIAVDRPTSLPFATGSGSILTIRFKPVSSTVQGSSALQWTLPHCWSTLTSTINGPVLSNDNLVRAYNGTVTVQ